MNFLQTLVTDTEDIVLPVLEGLAQTPTAQMLEKYTLQAIIAVEFKQTSININGYTISVSWNNAPTGESIAAIFQAIEKTIAGQTGSFTSGVVSISIEKAPAAASGTAA